MIKAKMSVKIVAPILVLLVTVALIALMVFNKPIVEKKPVDEASRKVTAIPIIKTHVSFPVESQGVVDPLVKIRFLSEVSGKIVWVSPSWHNGGLFKKGEVLLRVEDFYYRGQYEKAQANLEKAKTALTQERAAAHVAQKTWESGGHKQDDPAAKALALRQPQLHTAEAALVSAEADVVAAQKMLDKTELKAPFDGVLNKKTVDIGQVLGQGQELAEFYGIAKAKIRVPLTQEQQSYLDLPPLGETTDKPVDVIDNSVNKTRHYQARLVRTSGVLDDKTRVLHAIIEVDDPYNLHKKRPYILALGNFVEVEITSREQKDAVVLPYRLLRPGNNIWVADKENKLRRRMVELYPAPEGVIYIKSGLEASDRVITSSIVDAYPGNIVDVTMQDKAEL